MKLLFFIHVKKILKVRDIEFLEIHRNIPRYRPNAKDLALLTLLVTKHAQGPLQIMLCHLAAPVFKF